jgi:hypothetical protein
VALSDSNAHFGLSALRIFFLLSFRRPALARVHNNDWRAAELARHQHLFSWSEIDGIWMSVNIPFRNVTGRVAYLVDDMEYRADVCVLTVSGFRPRSALIVWYDPKNPHHATGLGLNYALAGLFASAMMACAPFVFGF